MEAPGRHRPAGKHRESILKSYTSLLSDAHGVPPQAGWTGPECPNETYKTPATGHCTPFCLFKLDSDPNEHRERRSL